jgi:hypothetical protein
MREGGVAMTDGVLLAGAGSVAGGPVADLARAAGLGCGGDVTLLAAGDVLPHGPVLPPD